MPDQAFAVTRADDVSGIFKVPDADEIHLMVGGVVASVSVVLEAHAILKAASGLMVRQPLTRFANPLAMCDYHAEAAPYRDQFYSVLSFNGRGAAGRPATKHAFMHALLVRSEAAMQQAPLLGSMHLVAEGLEAMGTDVSYVMAISKMAVGILVKQHQWQLRGQLRQAQQQAIRECRRREGEFACSTVTACGTGDCPFAQGICRQVSTPAGPGRTSRPANHDGGSYSADTALADLERLVPFRLPAVS